MAKKSRYTKRADGLLETTRTDKRTGKRIHFYGHTDREIEEQIMAFTSDQNRGRLFKEVAKEWHDQHWPTLASNTLRSYRPAYARAVEEFGNQPISKITPPNVKKYINEFARGGMAKKTVTTQFQILNMIFSYAVENGDLTYSPCDHISIPKNLPKARREAATPEEEAKVKASTDVWLFPFFVLYSGLRKGEALAITWEDIDFDANEIHVTKSVYHEGDRPYIKRPKTAAGNRTVPLLEPLKTALQSVSRGAPTDYVFSDTGSSPLTNRRYITLWSHWQKETGVTATAHQLRHSFATMLFECGVDVKDAQDILGHSTAAVTQDIYTHIRDSRRKLTAKTLNEKIKEAEEAAKKAAPKSGNS